jgi:hypothetical protein
MKVFKRLTRLLGAQAGLADGRLDLGVADKLLDFPEVHLRLHRVGRGRTAKAVVRPRALRNALFEIVCAGLVRVAVT